MELTALVVLGHAVGAVGIGWVYFRRWAVTRPPIGVVNQADVLAMLGGIVLIPVLYAALPSWGIAALLALGTLSALYFALEPILHSSMIRWLVVTVTAIGELATLIGPEPTTTGHLVINNALLVVGVVGVANLWAQSGMKARDVTLLGAGLAVYDVAATSWLPVMRDLFGQVSHLPFAPMVVWTNGSAQNTVALGLGDLLAATVFPLVMRKAYGRGAGSAALISGPALIAAVFAVSALGGIRIFPVMAVLGPAMVLQNAYWTARRGPERTTAQYLAASPRRGPRSVP